MIKTTALHVHYAFSTFLWRPLHDYDVKPPNLTFYGGCGHKTTIFPSSFSTWRTEIRKNSTPGKVACIWHIERVQIDAIEFERTQILFWTTFSCTAVVVVVNHSYDYRPNCTPLSPVTITNQCHNKRVLRFILSKLIYKSNRKLFPCICIAWYKHSRSWENSPSPSRVYIRLCKHGKRFLLLTHYILTELMLFTHAINQIHFLQVGHRIHF